LEEMNLRVLLSFTAVGNSNPGWKYRYYWNRYLNYDNPNLQQCNIHG
jgi:hypothetical protein